MTFIASCLQLPTSSTKATLEYAPVPSSLMRLKLSFVSFFLWGQGEPGGEADGLGTLRFFSRDGGGDICPRLGLEAVGSLSPSAMKFSDSGLTIP